MTTRTKTQDRKNKTPLRNTHRPVTVRVEYVYALPDETHLPQETQMYVNLKGNREIGEQLIAEIRQQIDKVDFFAVTVEGPS